MANGALAARKMALILAACAGLVGGGGLVAREGWVLKGYPDPVVGAKLPTACAGVTEGVVLGKVYSEDDCIEMTLNALIKHAGPIAQCLPDAEPFPPPAFVQQQVDTGFNLGVPKYLKSSMCRKVHERDYRGACEAITLYKYADNGKRDCTIRSNGCYGVWLRRLETRDKCLATL